MEPQVKHGLLCPVCRTDLLMSDRQGIEVDYCPRCRGVWLDRGELDKIIERSSTQPERPPYDPRQAEHYSSPPPRRYDDDDYHKHRGDHRYRKKKSWLGEILDFD